MSSSLGAMGSLPGKLRLLLVSYKDQLPDSLKDEIKLLIEDLEDAHNVLVDLSRAEAPMVKLWRNEMREMSYDMEDYIDKQTTHLGYNQFDVEEFGILVDLTRDACKSNYRYHLGRLRPQNPSFLTGGHSRVQTLNREATYIVGMDDARRKLISWLRDDAEQRLKVVPILGPVGVGKTTLAQQVYREIGGWFECRAFVRASRMTDTGRLLWSIISQIKHNQRPSHDYTVQKLLDCLSEHLQHKRYFIVIDGLWETASWNIVISAFPGNTCCSRVLITTDIEEVALECSDYQPNSIFLVEPLRRDYSADLLYNRVSGYKPELSEQLKENLEDIIRTCCGLPLAIISIANILESQPDNPLLWCQVKECISSRLRNNLTPEGILREIVGLSYDCLSHDLKICLLYLAVYPEGYTFLKADLLKQWISEGFISAVKENANEAAESIFDELVCRGLIQPNHINFSDTVWSYTVHSAMFEVIRHKSIEENFCTVIDYSNTIPELSAKVRRLSLRYGNAKYATKPEGITLSPVRSLIFHGFIDCLPSVTEFEVLRVINLEFWGGQEELDLSGISQLFQLRYMRVAADITVKLPAEMKGFQYLETLEIYGRVTSVPSDIAHLPSLLHLSLPGEIKLSDGTSNMRSLRTLHSFDLSSNSEDNVQRLGQMTDLHDLHLTCSKSMSESDLLERNLIALARSIGELGKLKSLVLAPNTSCLSCSFYSDCSSSMPCLSIFLQRLELLPPICIFSRLPKWLEQLRKLCVLKIVVRELTMNDIDTIAGLQELIILSLFVRQPSAEKIAFNRAAFPVLKYFKYRCGLLRLAFHAETMPNLRTLKLEFSARSGYQYDDMLTGIENLLNLQEVAGRIGTVPGAQESDMCCVESAFNDAIIKHPKPLEVNVQTVDWVDQETPEFSTESADLDEQLIRLARAKVTNVVSEESACSNISHPFFNENEPDRRLQMESTANALYTLEHMLIDERVKPTRLQQSLLQSITDNFSDDLQIGSGGFAVVYKGILQNGAVAIKKLRERSGMDEAKYNLEINSLMRVKHRNIVRFLGYCYTSEGEVWNINGNNVMAEERQRFLCFEYLPEGSLDKYIKDASQGLDWITRYQIIRGICDGLHYLHQQNIVHLDLKPANILLDHDKVPKIADFGLSKCFAENQTQTTTLILVGSPGYMAPESYSRQFSFKSDIYSLGVIIIEILTGQKGYPQMNDVLESWATRIGTSQEDTQLEPVRICADIGVKCTQFNRDDRPAIQDIIEKLDELERRYGLFRQNC